MKALRITTAAGVQTHIPDAHVYAVEVTANLITNITYNDGTDTVDAAVAAFDGTNNRVELGCLIPGNIFTAYVANYRT
jgi:hypothetical protein